MSETAASKRRLFVGIALDGSIRNGCAEVAEALRRQRYPARYESSEKLHVTVAFLGFVEASRIDEMATTAHQIAATVAPFGFSLDKLGAFPRERTPRAIYLGARSASAPFGSLSQRTRDAYGTLGFRFPRDAVAHVTIARAKSASPPLIAIDFAPMDVRVDELTLFESLPDPARNTSRYAIVTRAALSGG